MLKRLLHELVISLRISPDGPVLIKSGVAGLGTDMCFVTTVRNGKREVYLPGSSLKGVIRSHCEKICRTLQPKSVCEPFDRKDDENVDFVSCSQMLKNEKSEADNYHNSCPACRMFGSLKFKGRCFIDDAYSSGNAPQPHIRDGVGINRFTGAAEHGAKYEFEVITEGTFITQIHLVNFEMWQLELLIFALRDMTQGDVRIGMATSRGLGKIKVGLDKIEYDRFGKKPDRLTLADITVLEADSEERKRYGFDTPPCTEIDLGSCTSGSWNTIGIRNYVSITSDDKNPDVASDAFFNKIAPKLSGTLANYVDKNPKQSEAKQKYVESKRANIHNRRP